MLSALFLVMLVVLLITHDPPSGYNMGTGDSWIPVIICTAGLVASLLGCFD